MQTINITNARKDIYNLVENVGKFHEPVLIVGKKTNAVLISEDDWNAIRETLYLDTVPGMTESILKGTSEPLEDCIPEDNLLEKKLRKKSNYMKTAKEIIISTLKDEIPILTEAKYDIIAIRLVKELCLTDAKILSINEIKENGYGTLTPVRYNLELSMEDILLVEKYNGTVPALFFDPLYIHVLKNYFKLLGKDSANTSEITTEECVTKTLSSHGNTENARAITAVKNPVEIIRQAVNNVCDAVGMYRTYK